MSDPIEQPAADNTAPTDATESTAPPEGEAKTFDAAYVSKLRTEAAEWRVKAQEGKAATTKLAELEESQKSEAQKLADRLAAAEQRATAAESKAERSRIAAEKGVPADLLVGDTTEALEAFADSLLAFRGEPVRKPVAPPATGQGRVGEPVTPSDIDTQITEAQRAGNVTLAMRLTNQKLVAMATERNS